MQIKINITHPYHHLDFEYDPLNLPRTVIGIEVNEIGLLNK